MSDLAQAVFRCVETLSRLGLGPFRRARGERADIEITADAVDAISDAAAAQLDPLLHRVYKVGDRLQSGAIDSLEIFLDRNPDPDSSLVETWEAIDRSRGEDF